MIEQLNIFNGGLSITLAPHLIEPNESVENENVDYNSAIIKPLNSDFQYASGVTGPYFYKDEDFELYSASYRDFLRWQNVLLWSDGVQPKKYNGTNTYNLGIAKPTVAPELEAISSNFGWDTAPFVLPYRVYAHSLITDGTDIYLLGGDSTEDSEAGNNLYAYYSSTGTWEKKATPPLLQDMFAAYYDGKIYVYGGQIVGTTLLNSTMWIYTISTDSWTTSTATVGARAGGGVVETGGKIYIYGGYTGSSSHTDDLYEYDPVLDSFTTLSSSTVPRAYCSLVAYSGKLYAYGGRDSSSISNSFLEYDISTDTWTTLTGYDNVASHRAEIIGSKMYIMGGNNPSWNARLSYFSYDFSVPAFETEGKMEEALVAAGSVVIGDNIYYAGGRANSNISSNTDLVQVFTPGSGLEEGLYEYFYTFYNSVDGSESQPSPAESIETTSKGDIKVTMVNTGADSQADKVRLYRLSAGSYLLVTEENIAAPVVYTDSTLASNLGIENESQNNAAPPAALQHLVEHRGFFWGAVDTVLRYSNGANPNYWSELNFINFNEAITGISSHPNGLIVCTTNTTWVIQGYSEETFAKTLVSRDQGCVNHSTMGQIKRGLLWLSNDGICVFNGGTVEVLSKTKLPKSYFTGTPLMAAVWDEQYIVAYNNNYLLVDFRYGPPTFKTVTASEAGIKSVYNYQDTPYSGADSNIIYEIFGASGSRSVTYKTGQLMMQDQTALKAWQKVRIRYKGTGTINVYIDDVLVATKDLSSATIDTYLLQLPSGSNGSYLQFEVTGAFEVHAIESDGVRRKV